MNPKKFAIGTRGYVGSMGSIRWILRTAPTFIDLASVPFQVMDGGMLMKNSPKSLEAVKVRDKRRTALFSTDHYEDGCLYEGQSSSVLHRPTDSGTPQTY